ncbi:unnamed protein product [Cylindrotheca closterium]|uniref:Uncharacterized protein n=1 Tax=Cylindrotheca closterium TaxID=2856 RepID=A0AAD2CKF8_9STRA|nr:unnamed protein product [Cylindrotheca closterium]
MSNSSYINALVRSLYDESQEHNDSTLSGSQPKIRSPNAFDSQSEPPSLFTRSANTWGGQFNPDHFQRNAFAMMSASPVNMENGAFAAMTAASHHKYEKNKKRSDRVNEKSYWVNGSHVDETITYNQYTIDTAVLAPTTGNQASDPTTVCELHQADKDNNGTQGGFLDEALHISMPRRSLASQRRHQRIVRRD